MADIQCELPDNNPGTDEIREILKRSRKVAIVILSPKKQRDSNMVARYLMEQGYEVIPVNPGQKEILGETCYRSLKEIPFPVDVVDIFLNPARVPQAVDQAIEIGAKVIWMQLGIIHNESAEKARESGALVIMNKCIKMEHGKLEKDIH